MDSVEAKVSEWKRRIPNKRKITSSFDQFLQQKSISLLYTPAEQDRIHEITELISKATCEYEAQEDWERIIRVVDALAATSSHAVLKESIRFLKIRLGDACPRVVILSLVLTESIVKNCSYSVHAQIGTQSFLSQLEELYRIHHARCGRSSMEITERVLELIQSWGEAFLPYRNRLPTFIEVYHDMRKRGVKFPKQYDENRVPVLSVEDSFEPGDGMSNNQQEYRSSSIASRKFYDRITQMTDMEAYLLAKNVAEMFEDVIYAATKDSEHVVEEGGVLMELAEQASAFVKRMEEMIQAAVSQGSGEDLDKFLKVIDSLNQALSDFHKLLHRENVIMNDNQDEDDDFAKFVRERASSKAREEENQALDDDDPFAEFVKERATKGMEGEKAIDLIDFSDIPEVTSTVQDCPTSTADLDLLSIGRAFDVPPPGLSPSVSCTLSPLASIYQPSSQVHFQSFNN